jgi:hypothetical protein
MAGRKIITRDMIIAARDKGWSVSLTAAHYGMHRKSIDAACERFGIALPLSKFAPTVPSKTKPKPDDRVSDKRTPAIWSCSPGAIDRALAKIQKEKRLQASD